MNPVTFNNDSDATTDADYRAFVAWLSDKAVTELKAAKDSPERQRTALCRYYKTGEQTDLTPSELIDFLAVSTPSIAEQAGYDDAEIDALREISDHLTTPEIERAEIIE